MMYFHPYIDTETNASKKYPDSLAVDQNGVQQVYARCALGTDRPLFIPTDTNSYGKVLNGYVPLTMDKYKMGGIYHDEFGGSAWAYTYNIWDNHSAVLDPVSKAITRLPGNLKLLSREWELGMMDDIKRRGGVLFMNGHPATDAWRHARFSVNLVENTNAHWARWTHLYTPMQFTRNGATVFPDGDPKYNKSCVPFMHSNGWAEENPCRCIGRNILDQLDFGVLPFLYDGMFPAAKGGTIPGSAGSNRPNVLAKIFPIIVDEIGAGIVVGTSSSGGGTKVITRLTGSYSMVVHDAATTTSAAPAHAVSIHLYFEGLLKRNWTVASPTVALTIGDGEMAVIEAVLG